MATPAAEPNTLDAPWLRRQVETHLIFGFLAHRLPFGWVFGAGLALAAIVLLFQGAFLHALVNFLRGQADAVDLMLLGFIWFPGPEFMSSIASRQRYLTIARLVMSVLILFLGIRAGRWT